MQSPTSHFDVRLTSSLKQFATLAAAATILVGLLDLLGWAFDISIFKRLWPGMATMAPLTAVGFLSAGAALWLLRPEAAGAGQRRLGQVCAGLVTLIGGLVLVEYIFKVDLGIDRWFFPEAVRAEGALLPGRPALASAFNLLGLGLALLTLNVNSSKSAPLSLIPFCIAMLTVVGHAYGVSALYQIGPYTSMALHSAFTFMGLALGIIAARPQHPAWQRVMADMSGSSLARRLLPAAVVLPFGFGWLTLWGQRLGLYNAEFSLAFFATANIMAFARLVYMNAHLLNQAETKRESTYANLRESEERFRLLADAMPNGLIMADAAGQIVLANKQAEFMFGYPPGQLLGEAVEMLLPERSRAEHPAYREGYGANPQVRSMGVGRDLFGRRLDGSEFPIEIGLNPIETWSGRFTLAAIIDITERKQTQAALQKSEERFAKAFRASPTALSVTNLANGRFVDVNDQFLHLFGYSRAELIGHTSIELNMILNPDERAELIQRLRAEGTVRNQELTMRAKSGEICWVLFSTEQIELEGEAHALATLIDITKRKQAETEIQQSRQRLIWTLQASHGGTWEWNLLSGVAWWSPEMYDLWGVAPGTPMVTENSMALIDARDRAYVTRMIEECIAQHTDAHYEFRICHADQGERWMETYGRATYDSEGQAIRMLGLTIDITERKQAERKVRDLNATLEQRVAERTAELRASEAKLRALFEVLPVGVSILNQQQQVVDLNPALQQILKMSGEGLAQGVYNNRKYIHPTGAPMQSEEFTSRRALHEQKPILNTEMGVIIETGETIWISVSAAPLSVEELSTVVVTTDITERKRVEVALASEQALMQALMDHIPDTIYFKDTASRFTRINRAQAQVLGVGDPQVAVGKTDFDFFQAPDLAQSFYAEEQHLLQSGQPIVNRIEFNPTPTGQPRWFSATKVPLKDEQGKVIGLVGVSRDITDYKQVEAQLKASLQEKEVLLKEIHHRVKNNLQVISDLLRLQADTLTNSKGREAFAESQRRVRSMALIHEQLYQSHDLASINLGNYINSLVNYLRRSYTQTSSEVQVRVNVEAITVEIDQAMPLGLIINELVSNSLKYAFSSETPDPANELWVTLGRKPAGGLTLVVGDTGRGLPDEIDVEQSPSMGLQLVQSFVTQLHGRLAVQRKPGTIFTITIPKAKDNHA